MENKIFLLDTAYAKENGLDQGIRSALRYLIDNRQVLLTAPDLQTIYSTKLYSTSPTNVIFSHLLAEGLMDEYAIIDTTLSNQSTPELFVIRDITADTKQFPNASTIFATLKEYRNKMIINIAPMLQRSREGIIKLTDVNELHNQIVRGALVSSYFNCNDSTWLNPNLLKYICQTYSMTISSILQRYYQLDLPSQITISAALTWFFMLRMTDDAEELTTQCDFLGSKLQIRQMLDMFKDTVDDVRQFNLHKLCDLIAVCGPDHMKSFNREIMIRAMNRSGSSAIAMTMALEYPPYWVHQILYALSGNKVYLNNLLQRNKLLKSAGQFLHDLDTSRQFIPSVRYVTSGNSSFKYKEYDTHKGGILINKNVPCVLEVGPNEEPTKRQTEALEEVAEANGDQLSIDNLSLLLKKRKMYPHMSEGKYLSDYLTLKSARIARDGTIYYQYQYTDQDHSCEVVCATHCSQPHAQLSTPYIDQKYSTGTKQSQVWLNIPGTDQYLDIFGNQKVLECKDVKPVDMTGMFNQAND